MSKSTCKFISTTIEVVVWVFECPFCNETYSTLYAVNECIKAHVAPEPDVTQEEADLFDMLKAEAEFRKP